MPHVMEQTEIQASYCIGVRGIVHSQAEERRMLEINKRLATEYIYGLFKDLRVIRHDPNGQLLIKKGNRWKRIPITDNEEQKELRKFISGETQGNISSHTLQDIIRILKTDPELEMETDVRDTGKIIFQNGMYDAKEQKLVEIDPNDDTYY